MESKKKVTPGGATVTFVHQTNISVSEDGKTVKVLPCKAHIPLKDNVVQCRETPLKETRRHYTITVLEIDTIQYIMMGIGRFCWPSNPSWEIDKALRYHSNDGGVYNGVANERSFITYAKGDSVTCQVLYMGRTNCLVEFLKNKKQLVFRQWAHVPPSDLYPTLGFSKTSATLLVDWPLTPAPMMGLDVGEVSNWLGSNDVERTQGNSVASLVKKLPADSTVRNIVCPRPFSHGFSYFEIEVLEVISENGGMSVGVVPPVYSRTELPGWTSRCIGYHSDDGSVMLENKRVMEGDGDKKWQKGDVIGCGVMFSNVIPDFGMTDPVMSTVYFTRNGAMVYQQHFRLSRGGGFPCVGFMNNNNSVKIKTNVKPDLYRQQIKRALHSLDVAEDLLHSDNLSVTALRHWVCSVDVTGGAGGFVQMTAWPLVEEMQRFKIKPVKIPQTVGSNCQIEVGVAVKMTSSKDELTWLCKYNLTSGQISMANAANSILTSKYKLENGHITCMLDYSYNDQVIVTFFNASKSLGRGTFKRSFARNEPVCATVAVTGAGGVKLEVDWTEILFPSAFKDWNGFAIRHWLVGEETQVEEVPEKVLTRRGSGTSMQAPSYFASNFSYIEFIVTQTGGQLPSMGISTAWTDLRSLIGGQEGEISLDFMTGEIITNNEIIKHLDMDTLDEVRTIGMGVLWTKVNPRFPQDAVIYFTINNAPIYQMVFTLPVGGAYVTVTFPSVGCQISVKAEGFPALQMAMQRAWIQNIQTNKQQQQQERQEVAGTFSAFKGKKFSNFSRQEKEDREEENNMSSVPEQQPSVPAQNQPSVPAQNQPSVPAQNQPSVPAQNQPSVPAQNQPSVPAQNQSSVPGDTSSVTSNQSSAQEAQPPVPENTPVVTVVETEGRIVQRSKVKFTSGGEAVIEEITENGEKSFRYIATVPKKEIPADSTPSTQTSATEDDRNQSETPDSHSSQADDTGDDGAEKNASKQNEDESQQRKDGESQNKEDTAITKPETPPEQIGDTNSDTSPKTEPAPEPSTPETTEKDDEAVLKTETDLGTETDPKIPTPKPVPETSMGEKPSTHSGKSKLYQNTDLEDFPCFIAHQGVHAGGNIHDTIRWAKEQDDKRLSSTSPASSTPTSTPTSSLLSLNSASTAKDSDEVKTGGDPHSGPEDKEDASPVRDTLKYSYISNILMDPSEVMKESRLVNEQSIQNLSGSEAKRVLNAINQDMPPKQMAAYLSRFRPGQKG